MITTVKVKARQVYGNWLLYPNNSAADHFAELAGTKTLSLHNLRLIKALGFTVEQTQETISI